MVPSVALGKSVVPQAQAGHTAIGHRYAVVMAFGEPLFTRVTLIHGGDLISQSHDLANPVFGPEEMQLFRRGHNAVHSDPGEMQGR